MPDWAFWFVFIYAAFVSVIMLSLFRIASSEHIEYLRLLHVFILSAIHSNKQPQSLYDIREYIRHATAAEPSTGTLYRAVEYLVDWGSVIACEIEGRTYYAAPDKKE